MASKKQIANTITAIKTIFAYYAKDGDYDVVASLWDKLLKPYTDEQVSRALYLCMQECKYPPTPADIIERIKEAELALLPSPTKAWAKLTSVLYDIGELQYDFRFTLRAYNGKTQGEHAREKCRNIWESLPCEIREYLGSFGELLKMANMDEGELKFEKARFLKMFPQIQQDMLSRVALGQAETEDAKLISGGGHNGNN